MDLWSLVTSGQSVLRTYVSLVPYVTQGLELVFSFVSINEQKIQVIVALFAQFDLIDWKWIAEKLGNLDDAKIGFIQLAPLSRIIYRQTKTNLGFDTKFKRSRRFFVGRVRFATPFTFYSQIEHAHTYTINTAKICLEYLITRTKRYATNSIQHEQKHMQQKCIQW